MGFLPKSRTARRRLLIVAAIAPVLAMTAGLTLYGLRDSVSFFYTPSQARSAKVEAGRRIQLGGLVVPGSVVKQMNGEVEFVVADGLAAGAPSVRVAYRGELPGGFVEGQGAVVKGAFAADGGFRAAQVLAKHDEKYMPRELEKALKQSGEWRGDGAHAGYQVPGQAK